MAPVEFWFDFASTYSYLASDRSVVAGELASVGENPEEILAAALSPENKARLRERTERAGELGIFGAPSFISGNELFWGNDRMELAFEWHQRRS